MSGATSAALWLGVSGLTALVTALFAWRRRQAPGALPLALLLISLAVWTLTYALHWLGAAPGAVFWLDATFFGVVSAPVCVWLLTRDFTRPGYPRSPVGWAALLAVPSVTWLLLLSDPGGLLFGTQEQLAAHSRLAGGPWFRVVVIHGYVLMALSALALGRFWWEARGVYRQQAGVLLAGLCVPWLVNLVSVLGERPLPELDLTPMLFMLTALTFLLGLLGFRLFDLVPVARHQLVEQLGEGVVVLDLGGRVVDLNAAARRLAVPGTPAPIGRPAAEVFEHWTFALAFRGGLDEGASELEVQGRCLEVRVSELRDPRGRAQGRVVVWRDVTAQRRAEAALRQAHEQLQARLAEIERLQAELREQSVRDPLTGLHNRRFLAEVLDDLREPDYSVVLLDIDRFKRVNDSLGHAGGDAVLCAVAAYLAGAAQPGETVCRYGGEEFVVLLPGVSLEEAAARAEGWRRDIDARGACVDGQQVAVTVSLGVSSALEHGPLPDRVLLAADWALYEAKSGGRNRCRVAPLRGRS